MNTVLDIRATLMPMSCAAFRLVAIARIARP